MPEIQRRRAVTVNIGGIRVGSDAPVVVQSMTNTDTADVESTVQQVAALARAGSEMVRVTVNNDEAAKAVPYIVEELAKKGWSTPIIGDFHYNGHQLLKKYPATAKALAKYRINPGNCSIGRKDDDNFRTMVEVAVEHQKPVRMGMKGIVASAAGLAPLLLAGIGDTIRVSLTPTPGGDRSEEVRCGQQILQSLGIRSFMPQLTSCPGCGRTTSTYFQELAERIQGYLVASMPQWKKQYPGVEELKLAVMGCIVNGPGESKHANIGISLPGTFEEPKAPVYVDGKLFTTLKGDRIVEEFQVILDDYVEKRYGRVLVEA